MAINHPDRRKVLIGIPVLDNIEMTLACLDSLRRNTETNRLDLDMSLLILDNGSTGDTAPLAEIDSEQFGCPVHYLRNSTNRGVAAAWNQIIQYGPPTQSPTTFYYDYYVISNNDIIVGPDWLQPLVEAIESAPQVGWVSSLENGSPLADELLASHEITQKHRVDPNKIHTRQTILESVDRIYCRWGGHDAFCHLIKSKELPLFIENGQSAVCFMVRSSMIEEIGFFDEDFSPIGLNEDLEYFLRLAGVFPSQPLSIDKPSANSHWKYGFCGRSIIHHNWCMTRQGPHFDGRKWDKQKEKNWKAKFGKSRKYHARLLPSMR